MSENPYVSPVSESPPLLAGEISIEQALETRQAYIKHEASVRSIGTLYYLGAALCLIGATIGIWNAIHVSSLRTDSGADVAETARLVGGMIIPVFMALVLGILPIIAARGIRGLKSWGRVVGIVVSAIGLLAFPIGTIINGYILYLLITPKSSMIFSPVYKEVIALTPGVKYKTSKKIWILLGIVVGILILAWLAPARS